MRPWRRTRSKTGGGRVGPDRRGAFWSTTCLARATAGEEPPAAARCREEWWGKLNDGGEERRTDEGRRWRPEQMGSAGRGGSTSASRRDGGDLDKYVSEELWYAIAGPGVTVPQAGELVVFFPQGQLELVGGLSQHSKDLPPQIICRVLNLELKSKKDFVYALLLLQPEPNDMTQTAPMQELVAKDLSGIEWRFQHRDIHVIDFNWNFWCRSWVDEGDSGHGQESPSLQYWNSALQLITKVLVEMRRQLYEQSFGAFDELKGDYFAKIVEQPVLKLLNVDSMSAALDRLLVEVPQGLVESLSSMFMRISHALSTHKTIADAVPTMLELISPECRGSVSRKAEALQESVQDVFILQRVENLGYNEPTEYGWVVLFQKQIEHYLEEYIETSGIGRSLIRISGKS
nr:unnamed protein product [Digitaria exilis]